MDVEPAASCPDGELSFSFSHLPFQDTFAFVLISCGANANNDLSGNGLLPDGRKTGLIYDACTFAAAGPLFTFFAAPIDSQAEGATTMPVLVPASVLALQLDLNYVGVSWGPFGQLHTVSDWQTSHLELEEPCP